MLADLERIYLRDRDSLDDKQKKNLNHRIKNKLALIDETINDIRLILENYPEERIKEHVSNATVYAVAAILEKVLQILDPWPIGEHEEGDLRVFRTWGNTIPESPDSEPGKCAIHSVSRIASDEEIELYQRLKDHFNKIRYFVDPCIPDPVCRDPNYIGLKDESALRIAKEISQKTGKYNVSCNTYLDEWVEKEGKDSWIERKPSLVNIETLKFMRWKPRGLKECMEQPPLFAPKTVPARVVDSVTISSGGHNLVSK
jgi:hypothetical protein